MRSVTSILSVCWRRVRDGNVKVVHLTNEEPATNGPYWQLQEAFSAFASVLDGHPNLRRLAAAWRNLAWDVNGPLMIPVMGHFKAGKSTFLNALLGESLLCADVLPATAAVTVLRYGPRKQLRAFFPDRAPRVFAFEELHGISSETNQEWSGLREQLSHLEVSLPNPRLKGMTLVDTPGLNSIHGLHTRVTKDFVERADAIIWLFACPQVGTRTELDEIRKLPNGCRPYAVVNQIDLLDPEEQSIDEFLDDVGRRLGSSIHHPIGVSAKLALARDTATYGASPCNSWKNFIKVLDNEILAGSTQRKRSRILERIEVALDLVLEFAESERDEIHNAALALAQGRDYEENLLKRIQSLADLARTWRGTPECDAVDIVARAPILVDDVPRANSLNQRCKALAGFLDGVTAECEQLAQEQERLKLRSEDYRKRLTDHAARLGEYLHSGLFGGPPVLGRLFDGGKRDKLELEEAQLKREATEETLSASQHANNVKAYRSRLGRVQRECSEFVAEVYVAIVEGVKRFEYDLKHRDESQTRAHLNIKEHAWVSTILRTVADRCVPQLERGIHESLAPSSQHKIGAIADRLNRLRVCADVVDNELRRSECASEPPPGRDRTSRELENGDIDDQPTSGDSTRPEGWVRVIVLGVLAAGAVIGMWRLSTRSNRSEPLAATPKSSSVLAEPPSPRPFRYIVPDEDAIRQLVFSTQPDDREILLRVFGNVDGPGPSAIWPTSQLPARLDVSRLLLQATGAIAFHIAHREEYENGTGVHREFITTAGTGSPPDEFRCHACPAVMGLVVLRQDLAGWSVEAVDRTVAVLGENGEPADHYLAVRWGADQYGLLLGEKSISQGEEDGSATLVGVIDAVPVVIGTFDGISHDDCGGVLNEPTPCRSERSDISFVEVPGYGAWDLLIRKQVDKGLRPGESDITVRRFRFDGRGYEELAVTSGMPDAAVLVPPPDSGPVPLAVTDLLRRQRATISGQMAPASPHVPSHDSGTIPAAVLEVLRRWRDTTISEDVDTHLQCYATVLERYFSAHSYSSSQLRADKVSIFKRYPKFTKYEISDLSLESATPSRITVSFRKEWEAVGISRSAGVVRSELTFALVKGEWKITAEFDRSGK